MSVTQKDISVFLKIPRITVARALTGGIVSESTRQRVVDAAEKLGYTTSTNLEARRLIAKRYGRQPLTDAIAVLLPPQDKPVRGTAFFDSLLEGIEVEAERRRLDTVICVARQRGIPAIIRNGVDGVLSLGLTHELQEQLVALNLPVVTPTFFTEPFHSVLTEDRQGIGLIVEHLHSLGHRKIGYCGYPGDSTLSEVRFAAYKAELALRGLPVDSRYVMLVGLSRETAETAIGEMLERSRRDGDQLPEFTALVCYNDYFASLVMFGLERHGIRVPADVSVTGYDATTLANGALPTLTSIDYDRVEMGRIAVDILCRVRSKTHGAQDTPSIVERVPVTLRALETTAPARE